MPELKNPRWEKFARLYVELGNASLAYRKAGYKVPEASARAEACRLLTNVNVKQRVSLLRAKELFNRDMKREELAGYYIAAITTPVGEIDEHSPLAQAVEYTENGKKVKAPDKNAAAAGLARLNGWDAPAKVEITNDNPLTVYLRALRSDVMTDRYDLPTNTTQVIDDQH